MRTQTAKLCAILLLFSASRAAAVSSDRAAAIVVYPHIVLDIAKGIDTFVQLANRDSAAIDVHCFLENTNKHCTDTGAVCQSSADCSPAACVDGWQSLDFAIRLTARQPIGWHASSGAASLPLPSNAGSIPAVPENPFRGSLRCIAVDDLGAPADRNVLDGVATVERFEAGSPPEIDAARYNAVGIAAIAGANDGDNELVLGGSTPEYESCPATVLLNHFFDFAVEPMTHTNEVFTDLALVSCGGDFFFQEPGAAVVQFFVYNEFEQRFSTSRPLSGRLESQISLIDTTDPTRSIFSAGVAGTLTGQTRLSSIGAGVVGIAVEMHRLIGQPAGTSASAAFNLHSQGVRPEADTVLAGEPPLCRLAPATGCRTARTTSLELEDRADDAADELAWRWRGGQATTPEELGNPTTTTRYGLCLYAGAGSTRILTTEIDASSLWKRIATKGFKLSDRAGTNGGVERLVVRSSRRDAARALIDGAGPNLGPPPLPIETPLVVQLVNDAGLCFEADYDAADVIRNESGRFKAKSTR